MAVIPSPAALYLWRDQALREIELFHLSEAMSNWDSKVQHHLAGSRRFIIGAEQIPLPMSAFGRRQTTTEDSRDPDHSSSVGFMHGRGQSHHHLPVTDSSRAANTSDTRVLLRAAQKSARTKCARQTCQAGIVTVTGDAHHHWEKYSGRAGPEASS